MSDLSYKLDNAGHEWFEAEKERDAARAEVERLTRERDAARGDRDETRRQIDDVAGRRDAAQADVVRLTREQGELRQRFHEVLRELGQTRVSAHATAEYAGKAEQLRHDLDDLRRLAREVTDNIDISDPGKALAIAARALVAALPAEGADGG